MASWNDAFNSYCEVIYAFKFELFLLKNVVYDVHIERFTSS